MEHGDWSGSRNETPMNRLRILPVLLIGAALLCGTAQSQSTEERVAALEQEVADLRSLLASVGMLTVNTYLAEAGFHAMDEALHQGDLDPRYLNTVRETATVVAALRWPEGLDGIAEEFLAAAGELASALEAEDVDAAAAAAAVVHDKQHELSHNIVAFVGDGHGGGEETEIPEGAVRVLLELNQRGGATGGATTTAIRHGDTVALTVRSAAAGELHLHGYDLEWHLAPGDESTSVFEANATGRFPLEFHPEGEGDDRGVAVGYLEVRP
jgi:hypothetical protein